MMVPPLNLLDLSDGVQLLDLHGMVKAKRIIFAHGLILTLIKYKEV